MGKLQQAREKLDNTMRAINEEKVNLMEAIKQKERTNKELVDLEFNFSEKEKELENLVKELNEYTELVKEKREELLDIDAIQIAQDARIAKITEAKDNAEKEHNNIVRLSNLRIEELNKSISKLESDYREKEKDAMLKLEQLELIIKSKQDTNNSLEKTLVDVRNKISTIEESGKEIYNKIILLDNDMVVKEKAIKDIKLNLENLDKQLIDKSNEISKINEDIKSIKLKKLKAAEELEMELSKSASLANRENIVALRERQLKELYGRIGQEINI